MNESVLQTCTRCVMDNSDPDITFDNAGVCNHCRNFDEVTSKRWFPNEEGQRKHGESRFTKFFQNYYLPKKFNMDKRKPHLSSMIVTGIITREHALEALQAPLYEFFISTAKPTSISISKDEKVAVIGLCVDLS